MKLLASSMTGHIPYTIPGNFNNFNCCSKYIWWPHNFCKICTFSHTVVVVLLESTFWPIFGTFFEVLSWPSHELVQRLNASAHDAAGGRAQFLIFFRSCSHVFSPDFSGPGFLNRRPKLLHRSSELLRAPPCAAKASVHGWWPTLPRFLNFQKELKTSRSGSRSFGGGGGRFLFWD